MQQENRQQELIKIAKKFFEFYSQGKGWAAAKDICTEDAAFWSDVFEMETIQPYIDFAAVCYNDMCPNSKFDCLSAFSNESQVCLHLRQDCTHSGDHEICPVKPPTNKRAITDYVFMFTFNEQNKINKLVKIFNQFPMYESLGWPQIPVKESIKKQVEQQQ